MSENIFKIPSTGLAAASTFVRARQCYLTKQLDLAVPKAYVVSVIRRGVISTFASSFLKPV